MRREYIKPKLELYVNLCPSGSLLGVSGGDAGSDIGFGGNDNDGSQDPDAKFFQEGSGVWDD